MINISDRSSHLKPGSSEANQRLAAEITRSASAQTYYTIRFLVDHNLRAGAYRAYGYFRWVDDQLDQNGMEKRDRLIFVERQQSLVEQCYRGEWPQHPSDEESLLVELVRSERGKRSGLQSYIRNMMAVMSFDAERRGRLISEAELAQYTHSLAAAVTEAMHHFIGHRCKSPQGQTRYLAVTAAHITHMLRDTLEDVEAGYFNIPREVVEAHRIDPRDVHSEPYRNWIRSRVGLARACFKSGQDYLAQVQNPRCRMAGFAYASRFETVLSAIERDDYHLRPEYPECKSLASAMGMGWSAILQAFSLRRPDKLLRVQSTR
jgi:phytoene/squalene synthetase